MNTQNGTSVQTWCIGILIGCAIIQFGCLLVLIGILVNALAK